ncbi:MAG: SemiSWEET transporter [Chloroflexota bacterium]
MGDWLGFVAGAIMTVGYLPQVLRVYQLKSAREISLPFTILFIIGLVFWLSYGIASRLLPIILWNSITLVLGVALFYAKLKYGK